MATTIQLPQPISTPLGAKIDTGVLDIKNGKGISRKTGESTVQFFERLCTEYSFLPMLKRMSLH